MPINASAQMRATVRNAALFAEATRQRTLSNLLTGPAPKGQSAVGKMQTSHGAPIVRITDLETQPGKDVTVDIVHNLRSRPTMGDRKLEGRADSMQFASDTITVNQGRHVVDNAGAMFQSTVGHDLSATAKNLLAGYYKDLDEETTLYHIAGERGSDFDVQTSIVPLSSDDEFNEIMVNKPVAPTFSRHYYGGDATAIDNIDSTDLFGVEILDRMSLITNERGSPLKHVVLGDDTTNGEEPFFILFVSPRQWYDMQQTASAKDWNNMMSNAVKRSSGFNHPVFKGDCLMRENILVRKMPRRVHFDPGYQVTVSANDKEATPQLKTAAVHIERAFLLGSQALGIAYGKTKNTKSHFSIREDEKDNGNVSEYTIAWCNGKKALQFKDRDGRKHCHGRIIIDTAVSNAIQVL